MEFILEFLLHLIIEPITTLLLEKPLDELEQSSKLKRLPKWCRILLFVLICLIMTCVILAIILGSIFIVLSKTAKDRENAIIILLSGLAGLITYGVIIIIKMNIEKRRKHQPLNCINNIRPDRTALQKKVRVIVHRPLGSVHPEHPDIVYGVNYGYVFTITDDVREAQDAYIIGVDEPTSEFDGVVVAIVHRLNDDEDKLVVAPYGVSPTDEEILRQIEFQEKYFQIELIR